MTGQDALFPDTPAGPDSAWLSCGCRVATDVSKHPKTADGWYASVHCPTHKRRREVTYVAYGTAREQA